MAKLVQLTNSDTNENIYAKTPTKAVINTDGSNLSAIEGIVQGDGEGNFIGISITPELIGAAAKPKLLSISLPTASWTGSGPYTQVVTILGGTANIKVDLQGDSSVIAQMISDGCNGLYISNTDGVFTAYAINNKPTVNLTVQVTLTEVTS